MSETAKLELFKYDNVVTNTDKFDIDKALNENWDRIDEFATNIDSQVSEVDAKNIEQDTKITETTEKNTEQDNEISQLQTEKAELETELKELQEDFYCNSLRGQTSGEYIHVEDSSNCRCKIGIGGNHSQETTSTEDGDEYDSPSPDYPSEVECVGNNINYLPADENEWVQGTLNYGFEKADNTRIRTKNYLPAIATKQTISMIKNQGYAYANIWYYDANKTYISNQYALSGEKTTNFNQLTFTPPGETAYIKVVIRKTDGSEISTSEISNIKPKLEEGSIATSYSPYGQGSVEVNVRNKNLLNIEDNTYNSNGMQTTVKNGEINIKGTITETYFYLIKDTKCFIKKGIYTLSLSRAFGFQIEFCVKYLNGTSETFKFMNAKNKQIELTDNVISYNISFSYIEKGISLSYDITIQLEHGSTATDYAQYEEQTYIMPIQEEMLEDDYIDFENEEEVHVWRKHAFTGEETWEVGTIKDVTQVFLWEINSLTPAISWICNSFTNKQDGKDVEKIALTYRVNIETYIAINKSRLEGFSDDLTDTEKVTLFKAWLKEQYNAGTPVIVYYKLAKTKRLPFTDEQKEIAKKIRKARTYKNVTNITTDSIAVLDLDYAKDLETEQNKMQNEIDEIKQLLSTTQTSALLLDNMQKDIESEVE